MVASHAGQNMLRVPADPDLDPNENVAVWQTLV